MKPRLHTRREFLKESTTASLAGALYLSSSTRIVAGAEKRSRVVLVRHKDAIGEINKPDAAVVQAMLDDGVNALLDETDPAKAWRRLVGPDDIVGIKSNEWHLLPTPPELESAIKKRVMEAGVPEKNIGIRDRGLLGDPLFMNATALVNVRPLRTHHWAGVGTLLKNYIMFSDRPSSYHRDTCADLATLWKLPFVEGKTRLCILVLFTPLFHGQGPHHFSPKYTWAYKGMLLGFDPVAVDSTGVRILTAKRKEFFKEERPLDPPPKHVLLADTRHHLGTADPAKIDLVRVGWMEGALI